MKIFILVLLMIISVVWIVHSIKSLIRYYKDKKNNNGKGGENNVQ